MRVLKPCPQHLDWSSKSQCNTCCTVFEAVEADLTCQPFGPSNLITRCPSCNGLRLFGTSEVPYAVRERVRERERIADQEREYQRLKKEDEKQKDVNVFAGYRIELGRDGRTTKIFDAEGNPVINIREIRIRAAYNEPTVCEIELSPGPTFPVYVDVSEE